MDYDNIICVEKYLLVRNECKIKLMVFLF